MNIVPFTSLCSILAVVALGDPSCQEGTHGLKPVALPKLILLGVWFLYPVLCRAIYTSPCWCGWLREIISVDYFREGHLHKELTHSADTTVFFQERSSLVALVLTSLHLLWWQRWSPPPFFLSFTGTPSLPVFSEPPSIQGVHWLGTE